MNGKGGGAGLLDIAPPEIVTKRFEIRGGAIEVRGIKNREWARLQQRFPEFQKLLEVSEEERANLKEENLVLTAEVVVAAIIATGLGCCGDEKTEELVIDRLTEDEQVEVFGAIMQLTAEQNKPKKPKNTKEESPNGPLANGARDPVKASTGDSQQQSLL